MKCANPNCVRVAANLFEGTLRLVEMTVPPETRLTGSEEGFPICNVPSRYFWMCPECSASLEIQAWTPSGIVLRSAAGNTDERIDAGGVTEPFPVRRAELLSSRGGLSNTA